MKFMSVWKCDILFTSSYCKGRNFVISAENNQNKCINISWSWSTRNLYRFLQMQNCLWYWDTNVQRTPCGEFEGLGADQRRRYKCERLWIYSRLYRLMFKVACMGGVFRACELLEVSEVSWRPHPEWEEGRWEGSCGKGEWKRALHV